VSDVRSAHRNRVAIVGTGFSEVARHSEQSVGRLALDACRRAVDDAGLDIMEVDGLATYPLMLYGPQSIDGTHFAGIRFVGQALQLPRLSWSCSVTTGTVMAALVEAINAVATGSCTTALVWRAMHNPRDPQGEYGYRDIPAAGTDQFTRPYGLSHTVMNFALPYSRYMGRYGATREHMATFAVNNRANAALNPEGAFHGKAIGRDDYLTSPMVTDPLCMLDCDMPVDGVGAVVVTTAERAQSLRHAPAYVTGRASLGLDYVHAPVMTLEGYQEAAARLARLLWASSGMSARDVDVAMVYDGFSYFVYLWLEAFGFCGEGEAFAFIQDGRIAVDGELPLNTSGGALGMGRLHGTPQLIEGVRQIQGRCGPRQARRAGTVLVQAGGPSTGNAAVVLSKNP
jgi:acetyl-CoA acetyltransferase